MQIQTKELLNMVQFLDKIARNMDCRNEAVFFFQSKEDSHFEIGISCGTVFASFKIPAQIEKPFSFIVPDFSKDFIKYLKACKPDSSMQIYLDDTGYWQLSNFHQEPFTASKAIEREKDPYLEFDLSNAGDCYLEFSEIDRLVATAKVGKKKKTSFYDPREPVLFYCKNDRIHLCNTNNKTALICATGTQAKDVSLFFPSDLAISLEKAKSLSFYKMKGEEPSDRHKRLILGVQMTNIPYLLNVQTMLPDLLDTKNAPLKDHYKMEDKINSYFEGKEKFYYAVDPKKLKSCIRELDKVFSKDNAGYKIALIVTEGDKAGIATNMIDELESYAVLNVKTGKAETFAKSENHVPLDLQDLKKALEVLPESLFYVFEMTDRWSPVLLRTHDSRCTFWMMPVTRFPKWQ